MQQTKSLPKQLRSCFLLSLGFLPFVLSVRASDSVSIDSTVFAQQQQKSGYSKLDTSNLVISENEAEIFESTIPHFDNAEFRRRLELLSEYTTVPLTYNQYVQTYIDVYSLRRREQVGKMLALKEYYFPVFEKVLSDNGLPEELKYLAIVESALNPFAVSRVGATGLWQFMYTTGKMYNLNIDNYEDDRKDPVKASKAAAEYFKDMYKRYGDWLLVIAAYNCGPGNVSRAIRKAGGVYNFWAIRKYLPQETRGYVPAYIAATYIMNYANQHNIYAEYPNFSFDNDTVILKSMVSFERLSFALGMNMEDLKMLNPIYKKGLILASSTNPKSVVIPKYKVEAFNLVKDSLLKYQPPVTLVTYTEPEKAVVYKVRKGDYIAKIAGQFGVSVYDIKKWNGLVSNRLYAGTYLKIYKADAKKVTYYAEVTEKKQEEALQASAQTTNVGQVESKAQPVVIVPVGDLKTSLKSANGVASQPAKAASTKSYVAPAKKYVAQSTTTKYAPVSKVSKPVLSAAVRYHKVRSGDTIYGISKRYGVSVQRIMRTNGIANARSLKAGRVLKIVTSKG